SGAGGAAELPVQEVARDRLDELQRPTVGQRRLDVELEPAGKPGPNRERAGAARSARYSWRICHRPGRGVTRQFLTYGGAIGLKCRTYGRNKAWRTRWSSTVKPTRWICRRRCRF